MTTNLRELLSDAAQSDVRPDLAERAISGARTRRRQRVAVGGAVLAAAAVVLGVVIGGGDLRTDAEPRPTDVASLPEQLPPRTGCHPLRTA
jgi:ferric-dicitrate binding protein FerR (iron transport regulator)